MPARASGGAPPLVPGSGRVGATPGRRAGGALPDLPGPALDPRASAARAPRRGSRGGRGRRGVAVLLGRRPPPGRRGALAPARALPGVRPPRVGELRSARGRHARVQRAGDRRGLPPLQPLRPVRRRRRTRGRQPRRVPLPVPGLPADRAHGAVPLQPAAPPLPSSDRRGDADRAARPPLPEVPRALPPLPARTSCP